MKQFLSLILIMMTGLSSAAQAEAACPSLLDYERKSLSGEKQVNLCNEYQGKVIVIVNTASKCGYTYQYEGLEEIYHRYADQGLVVLGFPSNDFANQEPGDAKQIASFCRLTYGVQFPMFEKSHVALGTNDPLFNALAKAAGEHPKWNFHKYLIDRNGKLVGSFGSRTEPMGDKLINAVEELL